MKSVVLLLLCFTLIHAINIDDRDDYAALSISTTQSIHTDSILLGSEQNTEIIWLYSTIPSLKLGEKSIYIAVEAELFFRDISVPESKVRGGVKQRYGLFTGFPLIERQKSTGSLFIGGGVASDFVSFDSDAGYFQIIYDQRFNLNEYLTLGMGVMYSHQLGGPKKSSPVNLLPTLRWKLHERMRLSINWDNLEYRFYPHERIALVGEGRYDMSYFQMGNIAYQCEDVSVGGGVDVKIAKNFILRSRFLKPISRTETLRNEIEDWVLKDDKPTDSWGLKISLAMVR